MLTNIRKTKPEIQSLAEKIRKNFKKRGIKNRSVNVRKISNKISMKISKNTNYKWGLYVSPK